MHELQTVRHPDGYRIEIIENPASSGSRRGGANSKASERRRDLRATLLGSDG